MKNKKIFTYPFLVNSERICLQDGNLSSKQTVVRCKQPARKSREGCCAEYKFPRFESQLLATPCGLYREKNNNNNCFCCTQATKATDQHKYPRSLTSVFVMDNNRYHKVPSSMNYLPICHLLRLFEKHL